MARAEAMRVRRYNQAEVVQTTSLMKVKYGQVIALVHDMEVLLAEADLYCKDEEALADIRHIYRLTRNMLIEGAHNDD